MTPEWKDRPDCVGLWASIRRTPTEWEGNLAWLDADADYVTEEELASTPWNSKDYLFFGPIPSPTSLPLQEQPQ